MLMIGDHTATGPPHSNSGGRKRGACDRCRGQKLRCIPHSQGQDSSETRCIRCARAGADCTIGISGRAGRPRTSHLSPLEEQRGRGNKKRQRDRVGSRLTVNTHGNRAHADTQDRTLAHTTSSLLVHDPSDILGRVNPDFPASLWSDEPLPPFFNNETREALDFIPLGLEYSWALQDYQAQPTVPQTLTASPIRDDGQFGDISVDDHRVPTQRCSTNPNISEPSEEVLDIDMPNENAYRTPLDSINISNPQPPQAPDQNRAEAGVPLSSIVGSTVDVALSMSVAREMTGITPNEASSSDTQHQRMQKLSQFAIDLYTQVVSINSDNHQSESAVTTAVLRDQLVGRVLKSSITFATLLDSFSTPAISSSASSTSSPANCATSVNSSHQISNSSDSGTSPSASALRSERSATNSIGNLSTSGSDDSNQLPPIDITIILQLVICYIRIMHLHSIMYSRILNYLTAFPPHPAQHVGRVLPVFPGMQVGGVSLDKFGMFQIKLLVQISVHVLGGIETALGLPERHMVGKRKNGGLGLLESNLSEKFVECLMREKAWRSQNVESVRKHLRDLGEVLEGAIEM